MLKGMIEDPEGLRDVCHVRWACTIFWASRLTLSRSETAGTLAMPSNESKQFFVTNSSHCWMGALPQMKNVRLY